MKRTISLILSFAIFFTFFSTSIVAKGNNASADFSEEGIINALHLIESEKENYNLTNVNFANLTYSDPIRTYEYTSEGAVYVNNFIPLKYNDELVAWAVEFWDENDVFFQISTSYIEEINALDDIPDSYALIYDRDACYLYDGTSLHCLGVFNFEIDNRIAIPSLSALMEDSNIVLSSTNKTTPLGYSSVDLARGVVLPTRSYTCKVDKVSQERDTYKNFCWAASIACILRYNYKISYTMIEVVQKRFNGAIWDIGLNPGEEVDLINSYGYGSIEYKSVNNASPSNIEDSLSRNYPIYGVFYSNSNNFKNHAAVVYGCMINNSTNEMTTISVMDPSDGDFYSANKTSSGFTYTNTKYNTKLILGVMTIKK